MVNCPAFGAQPRSGPRLSPLHQAARRARIWPVRSSRMPALTPVTAQDNYDSVLSLSSSSCFSGYLGCWHVRIGTGEAANVKGLRVWKRILDDAGKDAGLKQWNVYSENIMALNPMLRQNDGNYEKQFEYGTLDQDMAPYNPTIGDAPARKVLRAAPEAMIMLLSALPKQRTATTAPTFPWGSEAFLHDGPYRWGSVLTYHPSGAFKSCSLMSEIRHQLDDPAAPIDFSALQTPEQRPRLPEDPSEWLPEEAWSSGTSSGMHVQPDGSIWRTVEPAAASAWDPAALKGSPGRRLELLPDSMYVCAPEVLPEGQEMRWEFGGRLRQDMHAFARMVVVYGADGRLQSVVHERYAGSS